MMSTFLVIISFLIFVASLVSLFFKRFRWKAAWVTLGSVILFFVAVFMNVGEMDHQAREKGYVSSADQREALAAGVSDPGQWRSTREAKQRAEAEAIAQAEAKRVSEERRKADLVKPPTDQVAFMNAVSTSRKHFDDGENDLQRGAARPARARAICSAVSQSINGWIGKIAELSTNGDGKGVVSVEIDCYSACKFDPLTGGIGVQN